MDCRREFFLITIWCGFPCSFIFKNCRDAIYVCAMQVRAKLVIDAREPNGLIGLFEKNESCLVDKLDVGDFHITDHEKNVLVVFERKTWSDFASSVTTSRLTDQTQRTVSFCKAKEARPILIIECPVVHDWSGKQGSASNKFLDCCVNKYSLEGYSVIRTRDQQHTRDVVNWIWRRCKDGKVPTFEASMQFRGEAGEVSFKKSVNLTPKKTWENMLTAIKGVSKARARDIAIKFPNAEHLVEHMKKDNFTLKVAGVGKKTEMAIKECIMGEKE